MLSGFAPSDVTKIITDAMKALSQQNSGGILTFGFLITIWSSSGAMVSIITTLNKPFVVHELRLILQQVRYMVRESGLPAAAGS